MGISTYCCLNPLPPSPTHDHGSSPSLTSKSTLIPRNVDDHERSRRKNKNVMATIACTIVIGLEVGELVISNNMNEGFYSMASEMTLETKLPNKSNKQRGVARWSDKRLCPPWHINSLETIVPENLPRPSFAQRKWEGVSYSTIKSAPSVKFMVNSRTSCFTM